MSDGTTDRDTERRARPLGRTLLAGLAAILLALALTACGGHSDEANASSSSGTATATTDTATTDTASTDTATATAEPSQHHAQAAHAADATHDGTASHDEHTDHDEHADHDAPTDHAEHAADDPHANHDAHADALAAAPLPGTSVYHLTAPFIDQNGEELVLSDLRGGPAVFVMFYGDCTTACPLLVRSAEEIEAALPEDLQADTRFVMVSFDTERDTPAKLKAYAQEKGLTDDNWHWLVGSPLLTRQLATLLGVQYRDAGNGVFAHSNLVTVLDSDGVPSARLEGLGVKLEPAVAAIRAAGH